MEQTRLQKVQKMLRQETADALLVWNHEGSGQPATAWLSGFTGTFSILLIVRNKILRPAATSFMKGGIRPFLITDGRYTIQAKKEARGFVVKIASGQTSALKILGTLIKQEKIASIIFDGSVTPYSVIEDMKRETGEVTFSSRKRILQELRLVKERSELLLLTKAAQIAGRAFTRLLSCIRIGMTEKEIAHRLEALCIEKGAEGFAFPTSIASGKNGALPHAKATDKKLKRGELITIDFGIRYKGYVSDMTRMVAVGKASPKLLKIHEAIRAAQELGCKRVRAGMTGKEVDAVCRDYLKKKGYGKYFTHSTGHGIGMEIHELPNVSPHPTSLLPSKAGRKQMIPVGAVITIEPGAYIPNVGGVRIEDALILTKGGSVNLSESIPKELFVLKR